MILILDNAESILDPQGAGAQEIYAVVDELSHFSNICLCITSRISIVPPECECLDIPTLSMESACNIFYGIYSNCSQSDTINNLLMQLDFHPLSITLLATTASHNGWDYDQLAQEWNAHHTQVLQTGYHVSFAATIELSLASPTFRKLGPNANSLLSVVAFFPQGIAENNIDWLFPTISNRTTIINGFCILSLTHQSNGFITMLAPLRDYLCPRDPALFPLLHITKERYFSRLSVHIDPDEPGFKEAQWITSEDVNVEHLLDIFTSIDANSADVWATCAHFMEHLYWYKPRLVKLGPKIEGLPDYNPYKPQCLLQLSQLFGSFGNFMEEKRLLIHTLKLQREQGDDFWVAQTLRFLADTNRLLGLYKEGILQAKEALEIHQQLGDISGQTSSLQCLAWLLHDDKQLDGAEEAAFRAIDLLPDKGKQNLVCQCYHLLGLICLSKGETEKAINHFETALQIAFSSNLHNQLFYNYYSLAELFSNERRFSDAHAHVEYAKLHTINSLYLLGRAMQLNARIWYGEGKLEEAKSEVLHAAGVFEGLGATRDLELCKTILQNIEKLGASSESDFNGEFLEMIQFLVLINSLLVLVEPKSSMTSDHVSPISHITLT